MLLVGAVCPPTASISAEKVLDFIEGKEVLIVNKVNRLELFTIEDESIRLLFEIPFNSTISAFAPVKLPGRATSSLLVLTSCFQLIALDYSTISPSHIVTTSTLSIKEQHGRPSDFQTIRIDSEMNSALVHCYHGLIRIVPLAPEEKPRRGSKTSKRVSISSNGMDLDEAGPKLELERSFNIGLQTLNVTDLNFLLPSAPESLPVIAVLFSDHLGRKVLQSHVLDLAQREFLEGPITDLPLVDPGSESFIPVSGTEGKEAGLVVVGEESLRWISLPRDADMKGKGKGGEETIECSMPVGMIQAWCQLETTSDQFILGDIYGKLFLLDVKRGNNGRVKELSLLDLGDASSPTSIVPISSTHIYLASRFADSQLIRLPSSINNEPEADMDDEDRSDDIQLIASYASLAPILDCCVVEAEGGGASHIVTCSGAYKGGSLRIVRQGVGLTELANLEMEGIQRIFPLKQSTSNHELLVLSFFNESRILQFTTNEEDSTEADIEEIDLPSFNTTSTSLLAGNLGSLVFQVTPNGINYTDSESGSNAIGQKWSTEGGKKITIAAFDGEHLVLALEGGQLILLGQGATGEMIETGAHLFDNEIACLDVSNVDSSPIVTVGLWTVQTIFVLSLPFLSVLTSKILDSTYLTRSVLVVKFGDGVENLFCGMGDGTLICFNLNSEEGKIEVVENSKKLVTLGTRPILLSAFEAGGVKNVLVWSDRPTVVSRSNDKLVFSSVNVKDITTITPFSSTTYPTALALSTPTSLLIGRISQIQKVDIKAIPLEEDEPRRICYDPKSKTYGVICLSRDVDRVSGAQTSRGCVKVFAEGSFDVLFSLPLQIGEEGQSITVASTATGESLFAIGTALIDESEQEPKKGRILLIGAAPISAVEDEGSRFELKGQAEIAGCPYAIAGLLQGFLAITVTSQVMIYSISPRGTLFLHASWGGAFIALTLSTSGDEILVGDAIRSVVLLKWTGSKLLEVAKDYNSRYITAAESLSDRADPVKVSYAASASTTSPKKEREEEQEYLAATTTLNLFTVLKENSTSVKSMTDEYSFGPRGAWHLGELVSAFRKGSLVQQYDSTNSSGISPTLVFVTSAGSIGTISTLDATRSVILSDLERNMRNVVQGTGGLEQENWRAFKNEFSSIPSTGFIDGVFISLFSELSESSIEKVMKGNSEFEKIGVERAEVVRIVESFSRN